ncbi:MAG TPA: CHASE domain-containing protein [Xanthomonadaceae bacterium]|nr:CHASE domain-containing protein [Xanthomonadaceae bacterium]
MPDASPRRGLSRLPLGYLLAFAVFIAALVVVQLYVFKTEQRELEAAETAFAARTDEMAALLVQRLDNYELINRGGVSLFASVDRPSRQQWQDYVAGLNITRRFPALVGLGYAVYVSPGQLSDLQLALRDSGEGLFAVHPRGPRDHYGPILYLEPQNQVNVDAIGYDMFAEPVRHAAMQAALETGEPRISGLVHLVQDRGAPIPSAQIYLPVFRGGVRPATMAARRELMNGWVYAPFRIADFVQEALHNTQRRGIRLRLADVTGPAEVELYADPGPANLAAFRRSVMLDVYGRRWRVDFESPPQEALEARIAGLRTARVIGFLAAMLLFAVILSLTRTRERAERLAETMSESYRRSELRFRAAMQYSAIGKALLDRQGRIVEANPSLAAILGSDREALIGTTFGSHFVEDDHAPVRTHEMQAFSDGVLRTTRSLRRTDGDVRQAQLTFAPVPGEIGQDITRLVQVEDITDRVRAEAQVLALNRSLEARVATRTHELTMANRELERFAYSVSHDLRAPLRAIDGFSRMLAERYGARLDEDGREYLARVRAAAGRMGELIDSLLKMARLSRGDLRLRALDLTRIASDAIGELRASDPARKVEVEIAPGLHAVGDPGLARSLLQNLLDNAWKFTRQREDARIEVGRTEGGEFFVRDNGAGFDPDFVDKLFRPFQRLHSQTDFSGHGIGLASVKRIVERHGGSIRAEGRPGEGATFYFTLPERSAEEPAADSPPGAAG